VREEVPGVREEVPGVREEVPGVREEVPGVREEVPGVREEVPGVREEVPGVRDNPEGNEGDALEDGDEPEAMKQSPWMSQANRAAKAPSRIRSSSIAQSDWPGHPLIASA
jgi:hypothetical protein